MIYRRLLQTLALLAAALLLTMGFMGFYRVVESRVEYAALPPTDDEIRHWLAAQPGVERVEVWRQRAPREVQETAGGKTEVKLWEVEELCLRYRVRFWRNGPAEQEVRARCERFGYKQLLETEENRLGMGWGW